MARIGEIRTSEWRNQNLPEGFAFEHRPLHFEEDGATVFREACKLGCEGVGSPYRSGRSPHWVKVKNPKAPAVKREAEENWGR